MQNKTLRYVVSFLAGRLDLIDTSSLHECSFSSGSPALDERKQVSGVRCQAHMALDGHVWPSIFLFANNF